MAAGVAHEINNPAGIILMRAGQLVQSLTDATPEAAEDLELAVGLFRELGEQHAAAHALHGLGLVDKIQGRLELAEEPRVDDDGNPALLPGVNASSAVSQFVRSQVGYRYLSSVGIVSSWQ